MYYNKVIFRPSIFTDCTVPSITDPFEYFWLSWDRQTKEVQVGEGEVVGTSQLVSDTYTFGEITDLSIRGSSILSGSMEFLSHPNPQVIALSKREAHFYEIIRGAIAIIFGVRGKNTATL